MTITLEEMRRRGHEQVMFVQDPQAGLRAIIAIHSTVLGPALGGTRMYPYASEGEALRDVLELSRGMTYKAAAAGLNLGGGKAVIIGDPRTDKSEALFRAFGRFVNRLNGLFYTGEDVGTDVRDLEKVARETAFVGGLSREHGGGGDPSPVTAYGVFQGMKACAAERWGSRRFAVDVSRSRAWAKSDGISRADCGRPAQPSSAVMWTRLARKRPGSGCRSRQSTRRTFTALLPISSRPVHSEEQSLS